MLYEEEEINLIEEDVRGEVDVVMRVVVSED